MNCADFRYSRIIRLIGLTDFKREERDLKQKVLVFMCGLDSRF